MAKKAIKVGIDLDQYTADNEYLHIICHLLHPEHEIHLISGQSEANRDKTVEELEKFRIKYSELILTANKAEYLLKQAIEISIDS